MRRISNGFRRDVDRGKKRARIHAEPEIARLSVSLRDYVGELLSRDFPGRIERRRSPLANFRARSNSASFTSKFISFQSAKETVSRKTPTHVVRLRPQVGPLV